LVGDGLGWLVSELAGITGEGVGPVGDGLGALVGDELGVLVGDELGVLVGDELGVLVGDELGGSVGEGWPGLTQ
jgi:hypothetical protein